MALFKRLVPYILVILLSFFAILPLFHPGFFPIHDDEQIARLSQLATVMGDFQIPPRWVPDLGFGYGFPLYNFYPPLVYYLGYLFHLIGFSLINSTKLVMGLGFVLSSLFMYLWVRKHQGTIPGLFAAFLYTYVPYHAVDIYVRGALSEFFSFVWIPAVFWSFDRLVEKKTFFNYFLCSIFLAMVVLTHNLVFIQFMPFLVIYLIYLLFKERKYLKKTLWLFFISILSSVALTFYFTLPSLLEKQYTLVDKILTGELANYKLHFVCFSQLINSPWGYGGSISGCIDGMSFQIGKMQLFVSILALIFILLAIFLKKIPAFKNLSHVIIIFLLFVFSLFMTLPYSSFIWNIFTPLSYIQFPWRFLLFTAVFSSFLGGFVIYFLQKFLNKKLIIALLIILMAITIYSVRNYFKPQSYLNLLDSAYTSKEDISFRVSRMSYEYVPKGVVVKMTNIGTTVLDIDKKDIPNKSFEIISGEMSVKEIENKSQYKKYEVSVDSFGQLRINTYSFPGWIVLVDSKKITYNDNNKLRLITVNLPKGKHRVEVIFKDTLPRTIGNTISLLTALFFLSFGFKCLIKRKL